MPNLFAHCDNFIGNIMKQKGKFVNGFAYKNIKSETGCEDLVNPVGTAKPDT